MSAVQATVEYRDIPGFPGYRVGSDGSVWSSWNNSPTNRAITSTWRQLRPSVQKDRTAGRAYWYLNLTRDGGAKTCRVHRLILEAFIGPCPEGMECRHLDGNPANNCLGNLCWGTPAENRSEEHTSELQSHVNLVCRLLLEKKIIN